MSKPTPLQRSEANSLVAVHSFGDFREHVYTLNCNRNLSEANIQLSEMTNMVGAIDAVAARSRCNYLISWCLIRLFTEQCSCLVLVLGHRYAKFGGERMAR